MPELLHPHQLYDYQKECVIHQLTNSDSMLWLQMGLGKTPITLTSIVDRMNAGQVEKTLVFGPLRVIQSVWAREARKWSHTKHLRFSVVHGVIEKRTRMLFTNADVYLCNYENMNWLAQTLDHYFLSQGRELPFQMVVYDEVSKLKNSTSMRMKGGKSDRVDATGEPYVIQKIGWRKIIPHFKYRTGLTGTPASNGYLDLHGQYLAVDGGKRLGEFITHYKSDYFQSDYNGWSYTPTEPGKQAIESRISDITKKMDAADYLDMPESKVTNMMVDLPEKVRKAYAEIEKQLWTELESGNIIEVVNQASVYNKCLQFCNGSPYLESGSLQYDSMHDAKLDALADVLEEAGGQPVLCSYSFKADAERIMKKFKKLKPVNLTESPSSKTEAIINKWNNGEIKLLIGHPACLHPSTQVLTKQRGWVKIIDVKIDEQVFDGVEFVNHKGCHYSGYKEVIDTFGVTMTPDHKIMINNEWVKAADVENSEKVRQEALYKYEGDDSCVSKMFEMRNGIRNDLSERSQTQPIRKGVLQTLCSRKTSQHDRYSNLANLVGDKNKIKKSARFRLRRSRNQNVRRVGRLQEFLQRHVRRVCRSPNHRTNRCEQGLLQRKLHMGDYVQATIEQTNNSTINLQRRRSSSSGAVSENRCQQDDANFQIEQRNERGSSSDRCDEFDLREKQGPEKRETKESKKEHVYDLVDCGPRNRFIIRNNKGECFISHNSMGHGIDGLQESGSILVWFGLCWSLELYLQMCGRLERNGQKRPVSIIRILCRDTVDLAVADAIERKTDDQEGLKRALQRYKKGITTNDLEVNFY